MRSGRVGRAEALLPTTAVVNLGLAGDAGDLRIFHAADVPDDPTDRVAGVPAGQPGLHGEQIRVEVIDHIVQQAGNAAERFDQHVDGAGLSHAGTALVLIHDVTLRGITDRSQGSAVTTGLRGLP